MTDYLVSLDDAELEAVAGIFDQVPVRGPEGKRVAANIQVKCQQAVQTAALIQAQDVVDSAEEDNPQPSEETQDA